MPHARSLVFCVRPDTTNIGNDLIAMATGGLLSAVWHEPLDLVALPSAGAVRGAKSTGLDARNVYEANRLADAVIVGGGNLFENGALDVDPTAMAALQPPLGLIGVSSGRVRGRNGRLAARTDGVAPDRVAAVCAAADPVLVRDDATAGLLADLGVQRVAVAGCPALFLDRLVADLPPPDPALAGTALVSLRNPRLMSVPYPDQARTYDDVTRLVDALRSRYDDVALLCHDYQDLAFAAGFAGIEVRYTEDPRRFLGWLRGCALSVGYRLHALLAAVALGVPALHIAYDERGEAMVDTLGLASHNVALDATRDVPGEVVDRLENLGGRTPRQVAEPALARLGDALFAGAETLASRARAARLVREEAPAA